MTTGLLAVRSSIDTGGPPGSRSCRKNEAGNANQWPRNSSPSAGSATCLSPPPADGVEGRLQLRACLGQAEQRRGNGRRGIFPLDQARRLELANPAGEQVGRDAGQPVLQVGVPAWTADQELPDDQHGPPVADDVKRFGDRAVLTVATHG